MSQLSDIRNKRFSFVVQNPVVIVANLAARTGRSEASIIEGLWTAGALVYCLWNYSPCSPTLLIALTSMEGLQWSCQENRNSILASTSFQVFYQKRRFSSRLRLQSSVIDSSTARFAPFQATQEHDVRCQRKEKKKLKGGSSSSPIVLMACPPADKKPL